MKTKLLSLVSVLSIFLFAAGGAMAHCEIPCGIYDDELRIKLIYEHIGTIEKSMKKIEAIRKKAPLNHNQLVRWISNKEKHADEIQHVVAQYFLTQRVKPSAAKYSEKLGALHKMMVYAMKCKQTVDMANVGVLRVMTRKFEQLYFVK